MTQVYKFKCIISFLFCAIITYACSRISSKQIDFNKDKINDSVAVDNKYYYPKIDSFVSQFDRKEDLSFNEKNLPYPIEDSLCLYFLKLNKKELVEDEDFKYIAGKLLEKAYLQVREDFEKPESFPVYNMDLYPIGNRLSHYFALNIALQDRRGINLAFDKYATRSTDFVCIDSVVLILDKLPQMQNDSNHQKCMYLVKNNKTGGCKW